MERWKESVAQPSPTAGLTVNLWPPDPPVCEPCHPWAGPAGLLSQCHTVQNTSDYVMLCQPARIEGRKYSGRFLCTRKPICYSNGFLFGGVFPAWLLSTGNGFIHLHLVFQHEFVEVLSAASLLE